MKSPPVPETESTRLAALENLGILDTPAEERFDRYTRLARRLFGVPIALVSLVDENDQALKDFSRLLLETFRESDVIARLGGDEFAAVLSGTPGDAASIAVERLRHAVELYNQQSGAPYQLRFSIGVIECTAGMPIAEMLNEADELMYQHKRAGAKSERAS